MTDDLSPDDGLEFDAEGKIKPSAKALEQVKRDYPNLPAAERWQLAQAVTETQQRDAEMRRAIDDFIKDGRTFEEAEAMLRAVYGPQAGRTKPS